MSDYGPYKIHPLADAFPLLEGEEFDQLVADIKSNGLGHSITLTADKSMIVDGRNRYRACDAANIDPNFDCLPTSFTEEQIAAFIMSENLHRRHLDTADKAKVALVWERFYRVRRSPQDEPDAQIPLGSNSTLRGGRAAERAGKMVGVSNAAVKQAKIIKRDAPDLYERMGTSSGLSLNSAYRQSRTRVAEQRKREPEPEKPKPRRAEPIMLTLRTHTGDEVRYPQPVAAPTFNQTSGPGISWADWSWNPVTGCLHGCDYCYAREIATSERYAAAYPVGFTPLYHPERLPAPENTKPGTGAKGRVFVCSMADLYGRWVPDEWIESVHKVERDNPQWEYLHLTKFPDRYPGLDLPATAWIGTSVDEQSRVRIAERAFEKIENVKVKWLSLEPLLEPLEFTDLSMFDWVVIGAQTATRQPGHVVPAFAPRGEWVGRLVDQAREAGCKVHCKPNLYSNPGVVWPDEYPEVDRQRSAHPESAQLEVDFLAASSPPF